MHRIMLVLAVAAVFLLASSTAAQAREAPTRAQVAKITKDLRKGGRLVGKARSGLGSLKQQGDYYNWWAWVSANRRCGDWYHWFAAYGNPYMACQETVIEWGCYWVPGWENRMAQCGTRWTNGGYYLYGPYRCRKGWIVYRTGPALDAANYVVYDHGSYPEKCGWGYW